MPSICREQFARGADRAWRPRRRIRVALCAAGEIWGGVEQCVVTLAASLTPHGVDPVAILFHDGLLAGRLRERGITVEILASRPKYDLRAIGDLGTLLHRERIDLLHAHGYKAAVIGTLAARTHGVRIVKTEHGRLERPGSWRDLAAYARLWANMQIDRALSSRFADALVYVSSDLRQGVGTRPGAPDRVIHNGVAGERLAARRIPRRTDLTFDIGIVGRVAPVKGHLDLFEAVRRLDHLDRLRVHVFGTGPLESACRRFCARDGLADRVRFHGFQPDMRARMAALDLLVIPSRAEGLPYALLEAMTLKVPVVAARVGGLREVLEPDECAVLVDPADPARLARAIERVYHDAALRARIARKAYARVREHFHADRMVASYAEVYRELVEDAR